MTGDFPKLRTFEENLGRSLVLGAGYCVPARITLAQPELPEDTAGKIYTDPEGLTLAGLTNEEIGDKIITGLVDVPTACLLWDGIKLRPADQTGGALDDFIRLYAKSDAEILKFASKWGVLGLCEQHRSPFTHSRPRLNRLTSTCVAAGFERLSDWRKFSWDARVILRLAHNSVRGARDQPEQDLVFERRWAAELALVSRSGASRRHMCRRFAQGGVNRWLQISGAGLICVAPLPRQLPDELTIGTDYHTLFDVLALQLLLAVAQAETISICAGECGTLFARRTFKGADEKIHGRWFCRNCRNQRVPRNVAQRKLRRKQAEALRLHRGGMSLAEVQRHVNNDFRSSTSQEIIEGWLRK